MGEHERESQERTDAIAQLLRTAGRRAEPSQTLYERAFAAASAALERKLQQRRRQRYWLVALAASVMAVLVVWLAPYTAVQQTPALIGRTDRIVGTVELRKEQGEWFVATSEPIELRGPIEIRTHADGALGVLLASGASLRIASGTSLALESDANLLVHSGKVYLDTGAARSISGARPVAVETALGVATDVGTQFEVLYRDRALRVRVREGRVQFQRPTGTTQAAAGEQLSIDAGGAVRLAQVSARDPKWDWTQALAPAPEIEGRPLSELLTWVARETGRTIRFQDREIEQRAATTILHGSVRRLAPLDALAVVLETTDLEHVLEDRDTILIRLRKR